MELLFISVYKSAMVHNSTQAKMLPLVWLSRKLDYGGRTLPIQRQKLTK